MHAHRPLPSPPFPLLALAQCSIRTTMTVTLSAEPRCTALLASLLHAASYRASASSFPSLIWIFLSCWDMGIRLLPEKVFPKHWEAKQTQTSQAAREDGVAEARFMPPARPNSAPRPPSPHLQAGHNEVHSFFWCEDFEEAITRYQDEPGNQGDTGFKAEVLAPQLANPSNLFYEHPRSDPKGRYHKSSSENPLGPTIHGNSKYRTKSQATNQDLDQDILAVLQHWQDHI